MTFELVLIAIFVVTLIWLAWYMRAQKGETSVEMLIQEGQYERAAIEAERLISSNSSDSALHLQRGDALQLAGRFEDSENAYRHAVALSPRDAAAREGIALSLAHRDVQLDEARSLMEETITSFPEIQEFQALSLAYILMRAGNRDEALRVFGDNAELLQIRFEMDYTDPDDLLAETLYLYGVLSSEAGDSARSEPLFRRVVAWAPESVFARLAREHLAPVLA